jgi:glucose-1-phosphate thymidylyltransferase
MTAWKGVVLAGGIGGRLAPLTRAVNKHLLPVFDKPMIYYPLTTLMLADIRDISIVTTSEAVDAFVRLLGDGTQWGLSLVYRIQDQPGGLADGLLAAAADLRGHNVALILGDNIFFGAGLPRVLAAARSENAGATVFGYEVADPTAFGVVSLNAEGRPFAVEEKPADPKSRIAVTGLYFYDSDVLDIAGRLAPSARGELEITDVNRRYLEQQRLRVINLGRGVAWLDGGTFEHLYEAAQFVKVIQDRTGLRVACPEEIAYRRGFIDRAAFMELIARAPTADYATYLARVLDDVR